MTRNGWNGWKWLDMAGNARNGWKLIFKNTGNGKKLLEIAGMAGNGWIQLECENY